ncbi:hypothetical protein VTK26DRAFT_6573 [Humicola hyalothermophila]
MFLPVPTRLNDICAWSQFGESVFEAGGPESKLNDKDEEEMEGFQRGWVPSLSEWTPTHPMLNQDMPCRLLNLLSDDPAHFIGGLSFVSATTTHLTNCRLLRWAQPKPNGRQDASQDNHRSSLGERFPSIPSLNTGRDAPGQSPVPSPSGLTSYRRIDGARRIISSVYLRHRTQHRP